MHVYRYGFRNLCTVKKGLVLDHFQYYAVLRFYLDELIARQDVETLRIVLKELYERLELDYCNR